MSPDRAAFLSRLSAGMAAKGIGQSDLARLAKVSRQTINTMFAEGRPGRKHLPAFAGVLGCSVDWLTTGTGTRPPWANGSDVVYGIAISSRGDRDGIEDAVSVARTLYENNAHELVESLFYDTNIGHLILREKQGIPESSLDRIHTALSRIGDVSCLVEFGGDYYPDPNEPANGPPSDLEEAPPWALRLLEEVKTLRSEVAALRPSPRDQPAVRDIRAALEPSEREHERIPTYPARSTDITGAPRHGK